MSFLASNDRIQIKDLDGSIALDTNTRMPTITQYFSGVISGTLGVGNRVLGTVSPQNNFIYPVISFMGVEGNRSVVVINSLLTKYSWAVIPQIQWKNNQPVITGYTHVHEVNYITFLLSGNQLILNLSGNSSYAASFRYKVLVGRA